jgi:hypothetical protein
MSAAKEPRPEEESAWHFLPLGLAAAGGIIQLGSCGTRYLELVPKKLISGEQFEAGTHFILG